MAKKRKIVFGIAGVAFTLIAVGCGSGLDKGSSTAASTIGGGGTGGGNGDGGTGGGGTGGGGGGSPSPTPSTFQVTASGANASISPTTRTINSGSTAAFVVTAQNGYTLSAGTGGSCPSGSWVGSTYSTGAITADCTVTFSTSVVVAYDVSTYAGSTSSGSANGVGTAARFWQPYGMAANGTDVYVVDSTNCVIRKVDTTTATVSTVVGVAGDCSSVDGTSTGRLQAPKYVAYSANEGVSGALYISQTNRHNVRRFDISTGALTTFVGSTANQSGSTDDTGNNARFNEPTGLVVDNTSTYLYVTDSMNYTIRRVTIATRVVERIAGRVGGNGTDDGTALFAKFSIPKDLALDGNDLYVVDYGNNLIRKVDLAGSMVSTLAGSGVNSTTNGIGTAAAFSAPESVTKLGGFLYIAERGGNVVRKIDLANADVTVRAGSGTSGTVDGSYTGARFEQVMGITNNGTDLFVTQYSNHVVRKIKL